MKHTPKSQAKNEATILMINRNTVQRYNFFFIYASKK